jgi:hypothetical protein
MWNFLTKLRSVRADAPEGASSGAAAEQQREIFGRTLRIAEDSHGVTNLTQVHVWTPTEQLRISPVQFYCLDMEETELDKAVNWIQTARRVESSEKRTVPVIFVIGPGRPLLSREWHAVNDELKPAGAYFYKRPDNSADFEAAMDALRDELVKQYGPPARRDAWRQQERDPKSVITW